ncbi:cysteine desulfurase [Halalkalibacter wakoensis JCM 9140]|uniref:Cysteine desulfurase n=1 Tax=Halalkalibacter wakoensis JCM 9140 TaxID=1236970 RepID=W4Q273_9BACI|nr:cysteine desulfurase family protein [Halalkalibacter wakoensis]GAE25833.1 cysteine desulfurase [Halalkalibacter wakoensis JCM 9140]
MIYLDNSATTKPYKEVVEAYATVASTYFGNPSSLHTLGLQAEKLIGESRTRIAQILNIKSSEIIFTSGGTEGNNIAIKGTAYSKKSRGKHLITTTIEHPSVFEAFSQLETEGFDVTYIPVDQQGQIKVRDLEKAIRPDTTLVSMIHVNNETGSISPIEETGELLKKFPHVLFHVDHVQGVSKVPLDLKKAGVDLCTFSAHKFHGMKGNGLLYVREGVKIAPLFHGGEQEHRVRAGTENVAGIVAMAKALRLAVEKDTSHLDELRAYLTEQLTSLEGIQLNSPAQNAAPHIVNFSVPGTKPEVLVQSLTKSEIYVSTKSACSSKLSEPSRVLLAMGLGEKVASSGVRVSFSNETTKEEINQLMIQLKRIVPQLLEVVHS